MCLAYIDYYVWFYWFCCYFGFNISICWDDKSILDFMRQKGTYKLHDFGCKRHIRSCSLSMKFLKSFKMHKKRMQQQNNEIKIIKIEKYSFKFVENPHAECLNEADWLDFFHGCSELILIQCLYVTAIYSHILLRLMATR